MAAQQAPAEALEVAVQHAAAPNVEMRCESRTLHGVIRDGLIEVKCRDRKCKKELGAATFHYFDPLTGELIKTNSYRDPSDAFLKKEIMK